MAGVWLSPASIVVVSIACCPKFKRYEKRIAAENLCWRGVFLLAVRLAGLDLLAGLLNLLEDSVESERVCSDNFGGLGL
jgi:hypothetical protein